MKLQNIDLVKFGPFIIGEDFLYEKIYDKDPIRLKLIKVTKKGFNFLCIDYNLCLLRRHMYAIGWSNKNFPSEISNLKLKFIVPFWLPQTITTIKRIV